MSKALKRVSLILFLILAFNVRSDDRIILAINSFNEKFYEMSLKYSNEYLAEGGPYRDKALFIKGLSCYYLQKYETAAKDLNDLIFEYPDFKNRDKAKIFLALSYFGKKSYDKGFAVLKEIKTGPLRDQGLYYSGLYLAKTKKYNEAEKDLLELIGKYPTSSVLEDAYRETAKLYDLTGRDDMKKEIIEKYLEDFPKGVHVNEMRFMLAMIYYGSSDYGKALSELEICYRNDHDVASTTFFIAECYFFMSEYKNAERYYDYALKFKTTYKAGALTGLFYSRYRSGKYDEALQAAERMPGEAKDITAAEVSLYRALALYKKGDLQKAKAAVNEAVSGLKEEGKLLQAYNTFSLIMTAEKKEKELSAVLEKELVRIKAPAFIELTADIFFNTGDFERAADLYAKASGGNIPYEMKRNILIKLSRCHTELKEFDKALAALASLKKDDDVILAAKGLALYRKGDYKAAAAACEKISADGDYAAERTRYGAWSYYRTGEAGKAYEMIGKYLEKLRSGPVYLEFKYELAKIQYDSRAYEAAIAGFREVSDLTADEKIKAEALYFLAKSYYKKEEYGNAVKYFSALFSHPVYGHEALFYAAWAYQAKDDPQAAELFTKCSEDAENPFRFEAMLKLGDIYFNNKEYEKAAAHFEKLSKLQAAPEALRGWALYNHEWTLFKMGKYQHSIDVADNFLEKYPDAAIAPQIQLNKGQFYFAKEIYDKAFEEFQKLIVKYPGSKEIYEAKYYGALSLLKSGQKDKAHIMFEELYADSGAGKFAPMALFKITSILFDEEKYREAIFNYRKLLDADAGSELKENALFNLGLSYKKLREYEKARECLESLFGGTANNSLKNETAIKLGEVYEILGLVEKAAEMYSFVIVKGKEKEQVEAEYWLGELYLNSGEFDKAIEEFTKLIYIYKGYPMWEESARFKIAETYIKKGDKKSAKKMLDLILDKASDANVKEKAAKMLKDLK